MPIDLALNDYVKQLRRVGIRPGDRLIRNILQCGDAAIEPLLDMATNTVLFGEGAPDKYAPVHALRLLGELNATRTIEPLLNTLPLEVYRENPTIDLWLQELPQILGRFGGNGVEALWAYADNETHERTGRGGALLALAYATAIDESIRDTVIAGLRERLNKSDDPEINAYLIRAISYMGASSAYSEIMARYRAGAVAQNITSAALARQLILTSGRNMLACAKHPLAERYDEHGPREEDNQDEEY